MSAGNLLRTANHRQPETQTVLILMVFYVCSGQSLSPKACPLIKLRLTETVLIVYLSEGSLSWCVLLDFGR